MLHMRYSFLSLHSKVLGLVTPVTAHQVHVDIGIAGDAALQGLPPTSNDMVAVAEVWLDLPFLLQFFKLGILWVCAL